MAYGQHLETVSLDMNTCYVSETTLHALWTSIQSLGQLERLELIHTNSGTTDEALLSPRVKHSRNVRLVVKELWDA